MRVELVKKAVEFLQAVDGTAPVALMMMFLKEKKGLTDDEILAALDTASGGELLAAAGVELTMVDTSEPGVIKVGVYPVAAVMPEGEA